MGDVVPFIARVRSSGDWTAAERARLQELADSLTGAGGARVEAVFGATDAGDPWCVVTDENGDVLIHVARIDGKFVVHSAVDDALTEDADLHSALRDRLNSEVTTEDDSAVVVPFSLGGRQAQTFLALVIATSFFYETVGFADSAEAAPAPLETPLADPPPPPPDIKTPTHERELAVQGAALAEPAPARPTLLAFAAPAAGEAAPVPVQIQVPTPHGPQAPAGAPAEATILAVAAPRGEDIRVVAGTAGDDELVGTAADERLIGGDGDDTLRGGGGADLLQGGAGDDHLELGARVTAFGGEGADTFEIIAPQTLGRPETLLGVVADFSLLDGDKIVWQGHTIDLSQTPAQQPPTLTGPTPPTDPTPPADFGSTGGGVGPGAEGLGPSTNSGFGPEYRRVDVDLDGDGVNDGYILVYATTQAIAVADPMGILPHPYAGTVDLFG
jgi:hypothetical protein